MKLTFVAYLRQGDKTLDARLLGSCGVSGQHAHLCIEWIAHWRSYAWYVAGCTDDVQVQLACPDNSYKAKHSLLCAGETADGVATSVPSGSDWFFLIVLYFYLLGIRLLIVMCSLRILNRLGPKMSYKDGLIAWWGGLRGALGLSLAIIADDASTFCEEGNFCDVLDNEDGNRILFLTGGIAFLTLLLNGSTTGWLLRRLGFTADDSARLRVLFEVRPTPQPASCQK